MLFHINHIIQSNATSWDEYIDTVSLIAVCFLLHPNCFYFLGSREVIRAPDEDFLRKSKHEGHNTKLFVNKI